MNYRFSKKYIFVGFFLVAILIGLQYFLSYRHLTVNLSHVSSATIYQAIPNDIAQNGKQVAVVGTTGTSIKLRSGNYIVHFQGETDYANGDVFVKVQQSKQSVSYNPYYTREKLSSLLTNQQSALMTLITMQLPGTAQYQVQPGELFHLGDWYGTTLVYKGQDYFNADTLRLVAHKEGSAWMLSTPTPDISLSKLNYPDIPRDVLQAVNNLK